MGSKEFPPVCVGHYAGFNLIKEVNLIILGDGIKDGDSPLDDTIIIERCGVFKMLVGPTIGGERNQLYYSLGGK